MAEQEPQPDERPRPKYGELAPPGWTWTPPEDAERLDTTRPNPAAEDAAFPDRVPVSEASDARHPQPPSTTGAPPPRRWNTTATILLIAFGFLGMSYSVTTLQTLPSYLQLLHATQGLSDYTPQPVVGTVITIGTISMTGIWALSSGLAVWLLVRRKLAFYVPLVAGVVALVALFVFVAIALSTDPELLNTLSGLSATAPSPTPAPPPAV